MDGVKGVRAAAMLFVILTVTSVLVSAGNPWSSGHSDHSNHIDVTGPHPKSKVENLEVVCSRDHMTIHIHFSHPFYGVVFSHSGARHERCVHVGPKAGIQSTSFQIRYDSCGTVEDMGGRFHENTIVIQFGEDILEAWDEAKRLRCEWLESFEKPSSKPTLAISDLDVVELNFQGDDIDCWMEVQEGKGPWSRKVGGLVPIGSPLTLVIAINDHSREFDMRIKRCIATDGTGPEIELTDHNGCVLRTSLLTPFAKVKDLSPKATLVAYSHIHAFKFPDKIDVYVHCIVEVCRHGCPDTCSHQSKGYFHPRGPANTLESKKHQLLAELAKPIRHTYQVPHKPVGAGIYSGMDRNKDVFLTAAQTHVHKVTLKNSSFLTTEESQGKKILVNRATFKPKTTIPQVTQGSTETKSDSVGSASNVHSVYTDVGNSLVYPKPQDSQPPAHATYHRIIGHDVHWIEQNEKNVEVNHAKEPVPSLGQVTYQSPQPDPTVWSVDDVRPLTKQEVYLKQQGANPGQAFFSVDEVKKLAKTEDLYAPQPEPAAWSAEAVTPLTKQEALKTPQQPKPEPATWNTDDIKPPTRHEIFLPELLTKAKVGYDVPHFLSESIKTTHIPWTKDELSHMLKHIQTAHEVPQPEPAPWKFEEVNPMHSPEILRLGLHAQQPDVPQPEPSTWTVEEVKPLSKEDLRLLSLNHKLKNDPHLSLPVYQEIVRPYAASTVPQPVYIPNYTPNPKNMSNNMKMMMMSTMLPQTYQTALWPHRPTTRFLRPQRHHYPYPIPQFSPQQQMMMSVIADRRSDGDDQVTEDWSEFHNLGSEERSNSGNVHFPDSTGDRDTSDGALPAENGLQTASANEGKISVGETYRETAENTEMSTLQSSDDPVIESLPVETPVPFFESPQNGEKSTKGSVNIPETTTDSSSSAEDSVFKTIGNGASPIRPPVSGFVPPALDLTGTNPETRDRAAHGPRALSRSKRSSEPVFGVQQKFQAIALSDLAFEWNLTEESASVLRGRREEIIYGICMSPATMSAGVGFVLILTLLSIIAAVVFYEHSCLLTKKTSQLSFITKNFNGRFEALYKITRPYIYSASNR